MTGIAEFISEPELLGPWFAGPSWDAWRAVLRGAFAEPMDACDLARFRELAQRDPPAGRVRELWLAIGRRGGKDSAASAIATYAAVFGDFARYLRPGERATILCLAVDRAQAKIVFGYVRAYFERVPLLAPLVARITDDAVELVNGVDIVVGTNTFRGLRGRTVALAVLDEIAFWRDDSGLYVNPDREVYGALVPALATLRKAGAMIVAISSVYRRSGMLFLKWREHHGKDSDVLVIRAPSIAFNPLLDAADIDADIARDPERGAAEWLSEWRSDLADFVDRAVVEALVAPGRHELPPMSGTAYIGAIDVSGGSSDSMALAIAHADTDGRAVLAALRERRPPFSPEEVAAEFADVYRAYGVATIVGDRYGGQWPVEAFARYGIQYEPADRTKSDIYRHLLPLLNSGKVELLDNPRLVAQLCALERRTTRGGRDSIDHPPAAHDDVANAGAIALVLAAGEAAPTLWRRDAMSVVPLPSRPGAVFATAAMDERGVFVAFWAEATRHGPAPLVLLDYDQQPYGPMLFPAIVSRLAELLSQCGGEWTGPGSLGAMPLGLFADAPLAQQALVAGLLATAIDPRIWADRAALLVAAATLIGGGKVRIAAPADARSRRLPLPIAEIRPDAPASAAIDAALIGLATMLPAELRTWERGAATPAGRSKNAGLAAAR